ncbi:hypothetical protein Tco_1538432 [Tanacetum coccineum]
MVDDLLSTRIGYATRIALKSYTKEFEKKAQEERKLYIDVVEKSMKDIIKDEVKSLLPQILPKEVLDFATPVIQSTITESLENDIEPPRSSKSKDSQSSSSKGTKSQSRSGKSAQAEEPVFETVDNEMPQDQRDDMGNIEDQPNVEIASKHDWFKKLERPPTPDPDWNDGKQIDFRPPQTWISQIAKA